MERHVFGGAHESREKRRDGPTPQLTNKPSLAPTVLGGEEGSGWGMGERRGEEREGGGSYLLLSVFVARGASRWHLC